MNDEESKIKLEIPGIDHLLGNDQAFFYQKIDGLKYRPLWTGRLW